MTMGKKSAPAQRVWLQCPTRDTIHGARTTRRGCVLLLLLIKGFPDSLCAGVITLSGRKSPAQLSCDVRPLLPPSGQASIVAVISLLSIHLCHRQSTLVNCSIRPVSIGAWPLSLVEFVPVLLFPALTSVLCVSSSTHWFPISWGTKRLCQAYQGQGQGQVYPPGKELSWGSMAIPCRRSRLACEASQCRIGDLQVPPTPQTVPDPLSPATSSTFPDYREPFVPAPECHNGGLGSCLVFLAQCSLVVRQADRLAAVSLSTNCVYVLFVSPFG